MQHHTKDDRHNHENGKVVSNVGATNGQTEIRGPRRKTSGRIRTEHDEGNSTVERQRTNRDRNRG